ncbi:hypothetical protein ACLOJK_009792, partial [Asimina triloba]
MWIFQPRVSVRGRHLWGHLENIRYDIYVTFHRAYAWLIGRLSLIDDPEISSNTAPKIHMVMARTIFGIDYRSKT